MPNSRSVDRHFPTPRTGQFIQSNEKIGDITGRKNRKEKESTLFQPHATIPVRLWKKGDSTRRHAKKEFTIYYADVDGKRLDGS